MSTFALVHGAWHGVTPVLPSEETELGLEDYADTIAATLGEVDDEGRSYWPDPEVTARIMYGDLAPEDARWAAERLRPQAQRSQAEPSPAPPEGLRVGSIIGANDRVVSPPELLADALAQLDSE